MGALVVGSTVILGECTSYLRYFLYRARDSSTDSDEDQYLHTRWYEVGACLSQEFIIVIHFVLVGTFLADFHTLSP